MERFEVYIFTALCSVNFLISCLLFSKITREQRDPYMDEIFHVPQAQKYCEGKFNEWDPMITTLPGLYLVSVGLIKPVVWLADLKGSVVCSTAMLRFINLLFNSGNLYIIYLIICRLHMKDKSRSATRRMFSALALSTFPVLYFFTFLYYTDAGSTFFTLFMYLMALYGCHKAAALLGICAILFRQTNIIWVAFCAGTVVAQKMDESWRNESKKRDEKSPSQVPLTISGAMKVVRFLLEFLKTPNNIKAVVLSTWPYITVALVFVAFVVLNDGIVVGDRSSHEAFPGYVFAAWNFLDTLRSKSLFWLLVFSTCLVAATVPQKLLEFRYFILPYLLYRVHIPVPSLPRLLLEFGLYTAVNAATVYIFIYKTFQWPDNTAAQRFMW
ncbi:hypothetical protein QQF64_035675 [Cirrhinus molitorella]|uniref:Dol-P-Glc:Glc(2)Man(9)GlcNAc(2)-PP-Dol alpha-1,2-glucosyltransferase n=1 Tax=Cirrhinus molitorella TaxID=172907 RepID=A0ABR3NGR7_9TELE